MSDFYYRKKNIKKTSLYVEKPTNNKELTPLKHGTPQIVLTSTKKGLYVTKPNSNGHNTYIFYGKTNQNNSKTGQTNALYEIVNSLSKKTDQANKQTQITANKLIELNPMIESTKENVVQLSGVIDKVVGTVDEMAGAVTQVSRELDIGKIIFDTLPTYVDVSDDTKQIRGLNEINGTKGDLDIYKSYSYAFTKVYTQSDKPYKLFIVKNVSKIFVTLIGGGGAGGLGYISNDYYYSGGGGSSGVYARRIPFIIKDNYTVEILVGKGGDLSKKKNGDVSRVKIFDSKNHLVNDIIVNGGKNGHPHTLTDTSVDGGEIVMDPGAYIGDGTNGEDGSVTLPSQSNIRGGKGADSIFAPGGVGGGGNHNSIKFIGGDGLFGSGGGGSAPRGNPSLSAKLSGNGGDGFVMIEFIL